MNGSARTFLSTFPSAVTYERPGRSDLPGHMHAADRNVRAPLNTTLREGSAVFVPALEGCGGIRDLFHVARGLCIEVRKMGGHVRFQEVFRNAVGDGASPPGEYNGAFSDLLAAPGVFVVKSRLVLNCGPTGLFEEFTDVVGQAA